MHSVLLVDDEIYARKGLRKLINWQAYGFDVIAESDDGEDALVFIDQYKPDLVITDIRMPVLDGLELIRQCVQQYSSTPHFIIVSGYDDFKYAQQAVRFGVHDFILKPVDEAVLQSTLESLNNKITRKKQEEVVRRQVHHKEIITAIIKDELKDRSAEEVAESLGLQMESELMYLLIEINDLHPWQSKPLLTQMQIDHHIKAALYQITGIQDDWILIEHRNHTGLLLPVHKLKEGANIEQFVEQFHRQLEERLAQTVYVYISKLVNHVMQLKDAYLSAKDIVQFKFVNQVSRTLFYDHLQDESVQYLELDPKLHRQLLESIEEDHAEAITASITRLFNEFSEQKFAPEAVKLTIHHCVSNILNTLKTMKIEREALTTLEAIISWQDLNISPDELKRLFRLFAFESADLLSKLRIKNLLGDIHKIKQYIEAHYDKTISLRSIASEFYMNPVYLGQLFKKEFGVYFNEFLLELRINEAKKLLRQTDLRIYEIATKVGFNHADYFVTQFAKIEKVTPSEYRNSLIGE